MEQSQKTSNLWLNTTLKGHITEPPNPVHHPVTSTFYYLSFSFILTCSLSILKLSNPYFNISSPTLTSTLALLIGLLQNGFPSEPHQSHTCRLQPVPVYLYYKDPQIIPSKPLVLQPLSVLTSHFHPLFCSNSPPFILLISFQNNFLFPCTP